MRVMLLRQTSVLACLLAIGLISASPSLGAPDQLDPSFSSDGTVLLDVDGKETAAGLALFGERILVGGELDPYNGDTDYLAARFFANGALDASFGDSGVEREDGGVNAQRRSDIPYDLEVQ